MAQIKLQADGLNLADTFAFTGTITGIGTSWQSVVTGSTMTAVAGNGYPIDTTSNACTVTLPAGSVGDTIELVDYAGTWDTNNVTLTADGSEKIKGLTDDVVLDVERQGIKIVYVDATQGWVASTGVNETAPALNPPEYDIDFLVVAGGGSGGGTSNAGGGGAGGYRTATESSVPSGTEITVTVGDGGATAQYNLGNSGSASSFSGSGLTTISSAGGGGGGHSTGAAGAAGGSGGGGGNATSGGAGNTPSTSPVQGYAGGAGVHSAPAYGGGGGGGASEVGEAGTSSKGGDGGDGVASSISGSSVTRGGGGGGGTDATIGSGGAGGGGDAGAHAGGNGTAGTVNTGGGGGAAETNDYSGAGGKGVVILSMLDADYSGTTTGSPTVATGQGGGSDTTTLVFTGSGTYTAQELLWLVLQKQD